MSEDKEQRIWNEVKRRAKEIVRFGDMSLTFKVQDGCIVLGEVVKETIRIA